MALALHQERRNRYAIHNIRHLQDNSSSQNRTNMAIGDLTASIEDSLQPWWICCDWRLPPNDLLSPQKMRCLLRVCHELKQNGFPRDDIVIPHSDQHREQTATWYTNGYVHKNVVRVHPWMNEHNGRDVLKILHSSAMDRANLRRNFPVHRTLAVTWLGRLLKNKKVNRILVVT